MIVLASCVSSRVEIPEIDFPTFPLDPDCLRLSEDESEVIVSVPTKAEARLPIWLYDALFYYAIDVDTARRQLEAIRREYNE